MESLIVLIIIGLASVWAYRSGKLVGSRKGYGLDRRQGHRRR